MRRFNIGLFLAAAAFSLLVCASIKGSELCSPPDGVLAPLASLEPEGTLTLTGSIDASMVNGVRTVIKMYRPIRHIILNSAGGYTHDMTELVRLLSQTGASVEVPDGATCQSACTGLLAKAPGAVTVAPMATLMFHSEAMRVGLSSYGACGAVNDVFVFISMRVVFPIRHLFSNDEPETLIWARTLSENLPALFKSCPQDPLTTQTGITLTGAEFIGLRDGSIDVTQLRDHCPHESWWQ